MALTPSNMLPLGEKAPDFDLEDTISGKSVAYQDIKGEQGTVVMFICVHCPYVIHIQDELASVANFYKEKGIGFVAISSNDVEKYPQDAPEYMRKQAEEVGFNFPYLFDESQEVAKAYMAACTPDIYVFDARDQCYYRGRLDAATPGNGQPNDGKDLRNALESLLSDQAAPEEQLPSMGCNIKWKPSVVSREG
ncbi:thioredoxin family protein [Marinoscillum sp. MHG1-6]|uniref:thioredoxin family protein n=1 Tax=Marinoscillum sp. MHG1-6 TaxID=2959627 RepID=UPI0021573FB2|nr:thioredoxin family protein [Marinoscillum sp. MHG1-6]